MAAIANVVCDQLLGVVIVFSDGSSEIRDPRDAKLIEELKQIPAEHKKYLNTDGDACHRPGEKTT
jgi:hypothetical protein